MLSQNTLERYIVYLRFTKEKNRLKDVKWYITTQLYNGPAG
jgi:hypothetical protein